MGEKSLAERAAEAMGWTLMGYMPNGEERWQEPGTSYERQHGWDPEHDANDALEFAAWARREKGITTWCDNHDGQWCAHSGAEEEVFRGTLGTAIVTTILSALEEQS